MERFKTAALILVFYLGFVTHSHSQLLEVNNQQTSQELYDFHINKMKTNKAIAWIAIISGSIMTTAGIIINVTSNIFGDSSEGLVLTGFGIATTLVSIPLFAAGRKHKAKANFQLQNGAVGAYRDIKYSGLSISVSF
ncbi:MAG: hypothetical protein GYB32_05780 [Algicola sp.]|nr:hypothetical protein [Algicola sp.]